MNEKIYQALEKKFETARIVFWYDPDCELRDDFDALNLDGVTKIMLNNNEFGVKHRILREEADRKFLIYHEGSKPPNRDNWLLDVLLAHDEFSTDQISIWLGELELSPDYREIVEAHADFFKSQKRLDDLKSLVSPEISDHQLRMAMLSVCANSNPQLESVTEALLAELVTPRDDKINLIERVGLADFLWKQVTIAYGYQNDTPTVKDFAIELFKGSYAIELGVDANSSLIQPAVVFINRWKDNRNYTGDFRTLSQEYQDTLNIEVDLKDHKLEAFAKVDLFRCIDKEIIIRLVERIKNRTIKSRECQDIIRNRENTFWFNDFISIYRALEHAVNFLDGMAVADLRMESPIDGIERYTQTWFRIDQNYRKYMYHAHNSSAPGVTDLLHELTDTIEDTYTNQFLMPLGDNWQHQVDRLDQWAIPSINHQRDFYFDYLNEYVDAARRRKIYVVISDALRYEVGEEFMSHVRSEDRYDADLDVMLGMLPGYTQLGMAALLPHQELRIDGEQGKNVVYVDGNDSRGTDNRSKILSSINGVAVQADDLLNMNSHDVRDVVKDYDVVYVYHNVIDHVGDKRDTEEKTFDAVEDAFEDLMKVIRKLTNANANNILVTADHGFLFQYRKIVDSDYISEQPERSDDVSIDRRFVMGQSLTPHPSYKLFTASQLGLQGDFEVQIPNSVNRLRQRGSGSRYVHGGASLQEILVPVLKINKKRVSDVSKVKVSIVRGSSKNITTGQHAVKLYQHEPVTDKVQARTLQISLYAKDGTIISDTQEVTFGLTTEIEREREQVISLRLSNKANNYNNQAVYVRLMETIEGTSQQRIYEDVEYRLSRSITSDF